MNIAIPGTPWQANLLPACTLLGMLTQDLYLLEPKVSPFVNKSGHLMIDPVSLRRCSHIGFTRSKFLRGNLFVEYRMLMTVGLTNRKVHSKIIEI